MVRLVEEKTILILEVEDEIWQKLKREADELDYFLDRGQFYFVSHEEKDSITDLSGKEINMQPVLQSIKDLVGFDQ